KGGESLGDEESSKKEEEVVPALILASGARPLAPDVKSHLSYPHITIHLVRTGKTTRKSRVSTLAAAFMSNAG
ncbi:MAG: hypothetical protein AAB242_08340, partial [Nitrospirota bacterium]